MKEKEFRIVPFGAFFVVQRLCDVSCGLFFKKTKKEWRPLTIMGHIVFGGYPPAHFSSKKEAKEFVEMMKKEDEIEYL